MRSCATCRPCLQPGPAPAPSAAPGSTSPPECLPNEVLLGVIRPPVLPREADRGERLDLTQVLRRSPPGLPSAGRPSRVTACGTSASSKSVGSSLSPPEPWGERTVGTPNEPEPPARSGRRSLAPPSSRWSWVMNHAGRWLWPLATALTLGAAL